MRGTKKENQSIPSHHITGCETKWGNTKDEEVKGKAPTKGESKRKSREKKSLK